MTAILIVIAVLMFVASWALLFKQQVFAPLTAWAALCVVWLSEVLPVNSTMVVGWLGMTLVVMAATWLQHEAVKQQTRGVGYMLIGALTGMTVGLLGYTFTSSLSLLYGVMIVAVVAGLCLGYYLFTTTPQGRDVGLRTGRFFTYLTAKGFPVAITVMQLGIVLVLLLAVINNHR